jgi:hypothetical protein
MALNIGGIRLSGDGISPFAQRAAELIGRHDIHSIANA